MRVTLTTLIIATALLLQGCATRASVMGYEVAWVIGAGEMDCGDKDQRGCMRGAEISEQAAAAARDIIAEKEARRTAEAEAAGPPPPQ